MSKPLVEILAQGHNITIFDDGSFQGLPSGATIRISLPSPVAYSQTVREAARTANMKHSQWSERVNKNR